jgi:hypothetical protein
MNNFFKKIEGKIAYWKRTIALYYYNSAAIENFELASLYSFKEINHTSQLEEYKFDFDKLDYENRFLENHIICVLEFEGNLACYGWINPIGKQSIGELNLAMDLGSNIDSLYDFFTFDQFRGKGLYPYLLQKIVSRNNKAKLIYVFPSNISSVKGIKKAGFKLLGNLKGYNKEKYALLIKKIWAE